MVSLKAVALTAVAAAALTGAASAADLLPPPPAMEPPPPAYSEGASGWYLRGDVGVGVNNSPSFVTSPDALGVGTASGFLSANANEGYYNPSMSESALFDAGVGYQVNNWFRADVTGELRGGAQFSGLEVVNDAGSGTNPAKQFSDFYHANVSSYIGMFNVYADLGTWYSVTPYVGAGVGVAYNRISGVTDVGAAAVGAGSPISAVGGYLPDSGQFNLAWALMAGLDFNVTKNLKLELGYRFLDYGKVSSGLSNCLAGPGGSSFNAANCSGGGVKLSTRELTSNDFRIGMRYYLDSPTPAPAFDQPLVRKY